METMNVRANLRTPDNVTLQHHYDNLGCITDRSQSSTWLEIEQIRAPEPGERAVVRCAGFQCLAYRDSKGRWREVGDKKCLPRVLEIILRF